MSVTQSPTTAPSKPVPIGYGGAPLARRHTSEPIIEHGGHPNGGRRVGGWLRSMGQKLTGQTHPHSLSSQSLPLSHDPPRKMSVDSNASTPTLVPRAEHAAPRSSSSDESTCMGEDDLISTHSGSQEKARRFRPFSFGRTDVSTTSLPPLDTSFSPRASDAAATAAELTAVPTTPDSAGPASAPPQSTSGMPLSPVILAQSKDGSGPVSNRSNSFSGGASIPSDLPPLQHSITVSNSRGTRSNSGNSLRRIRTNPGTSSSSTSTDKHAQRVHGPSAGAAAAASAATASNGCPIITRASCLRAAVTSAVSAAHETLFGQGGKECRLSELHKLSKKRVMFAKEVYLHDPPQQIPPMHPRTGNVEFVSDGELNLSLANRPRDCDFPPYLERNHGELSKSAQQRAHDQANRLHNSLSRHQFSLFSRFSGEPDHDDVPTIPSDVPGIGVGAVDGQVHAHELGTEEADHHEQELAETEEAEKITPPLPSPDLIYTRCCHLREILPIKSMLKQLKDQTIPVSSLYVANAKPTMIEILALTDLLAVVPVSWVSLDNTVLTTEMFSLILASLSISSGLHRLTLCNMQMDDLAWKHLALFVSNQPGLVSLDVSCDSTKTRVPSFSRRDANWRLLARAVKAQNALMHISVSETGISGSNLECLATAASTLAAIETANNGLKRPDVEMLYRHVSNEDNNLEAVNLGGNDLSDMWDLFLRFLTMPKICKLIVANSNLRPVPGNERPLTIEAAQNSKLLVLDVSGNKHLGPSFLSNLVEVMPHFGHLTRIDFSGCGSSDEFIVNLSEAVVNCRKLLFLGLREDEPLNQTSAAALCVAARMSRSLCNIEFNKSQVPQGFCGQITKYTLRNLERATAESANSSAANEKKMPESPAAVIAASAAAAAGEGCPSAQSAAIASFQRDFSKLTSDVINAEEEPSRVTPAERQALVQHIEELRTRLRKTLQELLSWKARNPQKVTLEQREEFIWLYFCEGTLNRLLWQLQVANNQSANGPCSGLSTPVSPRISMCPGSNLDSCRDEAVSALDESAPALSRRSSTSSLRGLRQLDQAEGESHKLNTKLLDVLHTGDGVESSERPAFEKLHTSFLERIIS